MPRNCRLDAQPQHTPCTTRAASPVLAAVSLEALAVKKRMAAIDSERRGGWAIWGLGMAWGGGGLLKWQVKADGVLG